jgi:hypothetical protein
LAGFFADFLGVIKAWLIEVWGPAGKVRRD